MLLLLTGGLLLGSILVLCVKRNWETVLMAGMCLSLTLFYLGLMVFIAKKGGYSSEVLQLLFLSRNIKNWLQYRFITLGQLGYLIALGRYLFPLFLLEYAFQYSMVPLLRKNPVIRKWAVLLPVVSLIVSWPSVYRWLLQWTSVRDFLVSFTYAWILVYVLVALLLILYELASITLSFCRKQYLQIMACPMALAALFVLYCGQDPGQVYRFYSYDYVWIKGVGYLQHSLSVGGYTFLAAANLICGFISLGGIMRYTQNYFTADRDDVVLENKFDIAKTGASVFVHSIKNQLLANRVLFKRAHAELQKETPDLAFIRTCVNALCDNNEQLIDRAEDLYHTVRANSIRLVPTELGRLADLAQEQFLRKYPDGLLSIDVARETQVLADEKYMSEALYNLIINAWEATMQAGTTTQPVLLRSRQERLYTVLEIRDHGTGITRAQIKHIYDPFYSSKNTNFNWGMGLYYTRSIVRSHLGSIHVENLAEGGASFSLLLPRYTQKG